MILSDQVPIPVPGEGQLLVKVYRAALNRMDLSQRSGKYPLPPDASEILGVEVSGTIEAVGPASNAENSCRFKVGDRVMSLLQGGGYAEFAVANEATTMAAPPSLGLDRAVAVPEHLMTAYQLLFTVGKGVAGESVLLHAGASGVGLAAVQLARRAGMRPFVTCRSDAKAEAALALGAVAAFNVAAAPSAGPSAEAGGGQVDWVAAVKAANGRKCVDLVLDPVGSAYCAGNVEVLGMDGRWVLYGLMSGAELSHSPRFLGQVLAKRLALVGTTLRGRPLEYKRALAGEVEKLVPSVAAGDFKVLVADQQFPFTTEGARAAHALMAENKNIGKIILRVREGEAQDT